MTELVEDTGGFIELDKLPVGDPTLSNKEIIGNESQERMGLIIKKENINEFIRICERERAPMYIIGKVTDDKRFTIYSEKTKLSCVDLSLDHFFGSSPETILVDKTISKKYAILLNFLVLKFFEKAMEKSIAFFIFFSS